MDIVMTVKNEDAFESSAILAQNEGFLVGISSGAALKAGMELAFQKGNEDKNIVVLMPDTGERYLSTPLFEIKK